MGKKEWEEGVGGERKKERKGGDTHIYTERQVEKL